MSKMTVGGLIEQLENCDSDKEVVVDPPYHPVYAVYERDEVVEIHH